MNVFLTALARLSCSLAGCASAQAAPQIKCEIGTSAWCIATFDGSISMQDSGDSRVWVLQARTADNSSPMKIIEAKACSDVADEKLHIIQNSNESGASPQENQIIEYALNSNGCGLRFEIPGGKSLATYRQVMLYGILVGQQKRTQLYKVGKS